MKIALFHTTLPEPGRKIGGVESAVHRLANALAERPGDEVTVFSLTPAPADARYRHRRLFARAPWLAKLWARWTVLPLLLNTVDFGDAEVLHLHGDDWFFFRRRWPRVRTMHGSARREADATPRRALAIAYRVLYPLERLSARLADRTLAIGADAATIYRTPHIVANGVDLDRFHPGEPGDKAGRPTVLFVGTWSGRKRGSFAQHSFVADVLPAVANAELVMVSDEAEAHEAVRLVLYPDDAELAALYRAAWVFAYPSTYEGFGIPYVEAMASGTAVVSSPNDGAGGVLADGRYGSIVDDASFGGEVARLLTAPVARQAMEVAGIERAREFAWATVAADHHRHYEAVVTRR